MLVSRRVAFRSTLPACRSTDVLVNSAGVLAQGELSAMPYVVAEGFTARMRGDVFVVPGLVNRAATAVGRLLPTWLLRRVSGLVSRHLK